MTPQPPRRPRGRRLVSFAVTAGLFAATTAALLLAPTAPRLALAQVGGAWSGDPALATSFESCVECHRPEAGMSHPVDVVPTMAVPAAFPLTAGRLTCTSCHADQPHAGGAGKSAMLTATSSAAYCTQCHTTASLTSNPHTSTGRAHPAWYGARRRAAGPAGVGPDPMSQSCLSCHDGSLSTDAPISRMLDIANDPLGSHPVGVPYDTTRRLQSMPLMPRSTLDPRISLPDGRVGCTSCHSVYSAEPNHLVMSNTRSRLCLSCHQDR